MISPDKFLEFAERAGATLYPFFSQCVIPIYCHNDETPLTQTGTGTLFRVADKSFLVTAHHVAGLMKSRQYQLHVTDSPPDSPGIPLEGIVSAAPELDVAVWELGPPVVERLKNRTFLTVHNADRGKAPLPNGLYHVYGHPNCWSEWKPEQEKIFTAPFFYGTGLYEGPTNTFEGYDPKIHVLLARPKVSAAPDQPEQPGNLGGISGSKFVAFISRWFECWKLAN
jgi:hypothetical protein